MGFRSPQPPNRHPHLRHAELLGQTQASDATSPVPDVPTETTTMEASLVEEVPQAPLFFFSSFSSTSFLLIHALIQRVLTQGHVLCAGPVGVLGAPEGIGHDPCP